MTAKKMNILHLSLVLTLFLQCNVEGKDLVSFIASSSLTFRFVINTSFFLL